MLLLLNALQDGLAEVGKVESLVRATLRKFFVPCYNTNFY